MKGTDKEETAIFLISASLHTAYINSKALDYIKNNNKISDADVEEIKTRRLARNDTNGMGYTCHSRVTKT